MKEILKLKSQIKILNKKIQENDAKNLYALKNKIKALKQKLQIEMDNHYWENYLSK